MISFRAVSSTAFSSLPLKRSLFFLLSFLRRRRIPLLCSGLAADGEHDSFRDSRFFSFFFPLLRCCRFSLSTKRKVLVRGSRRISFSPHKRLPLRREFFLAAQGRNSSSPSAAPPSKVFPPFYIEVDPAFSLLFPSFRSPPLGNRWKSISFQEAVATPPILFLPLLPSLPARGHCSLVLPFFFKAFLPSTRAADFL